MWNKRKQKGGFPNRNFRSSNLTGDCGLLGANSLLPGDGRLQPPLSLPSSIWESTDAITSLVSPSSSSPSVLNDAWAMQQNQLGKPLCSRVLSATALHSAHSEWTSQKSDAPFGDCHENVMALSTYRHSKQSLMASPLETWDSSQHYDNSWNLKSSADMNCQQQTLTPSKKSLPSGGRPPLIQSPPVGCWNSTDDCDSSWLSSSGMPSRRPGDVWNESMSSNKQSSPDKSFPSQRKSDACSDNQWSFNRNKTSQQSVSMNRMWPANATASPDFSGSKWPSESEKNLQLLSQSPLFNVGYSCSPQKTQPSKIENFSGVEVHESNEDVSQQGTHRAGGMFSAGRDTSLRNESNSFADTEGSWHQPITAGTSADEKVASDFFDPAGNKLPTSFCNDAWSSSSPNCPITCASWSSQQSAPVSTISRISTQHSSTREPSSKFTDDWQSQQPKPTPEAEDHTWNHDKDLRYISSGNTWSKPTNPNSGSGTQPAQEFSAFFNSVCDSPILRSKESSSDDTALNDNVQGWQTRSTKRESIDPLQKVHNTSSENEFPVSETSSPFKPNVSCQAISSKSIPFLGDVYPALTEQNNIQSTVADEVPLSSKHSSNDSSSNDHPVTEDTCLKDMCSGIPGLSPPNHPELDSSVHSEKSNKSEVLSNAVTFDLSSMLNDTKVLNNILSVAKSLKISKNVDSPSIEEENAENLSFAPFSMTSRIPLLMEPSPEETLKSENASANSDTNQKFNLSESNKSFSSELSPCKTALDNSNFQNSIENVPCLLPPLLDGDPLKVFSSAEQESKEKSQDEKTFCAKVKNEESSDKRPADSMLSTVDSKIPKLGKTDECGEFSQRTFPDADIGGHADKTEHSNQKSSFESDSKEKCVISNFETKSTFTRDNKENEMYSSPRSVEKMFSVKQEHVGPSVCSSELTSAGDKNHDNDDVTSEPEVDLNTALLDSLAQLQIQDDEDAETVLQVISTLTELYLKYKLRSMPDTELQSMLKCVREGKEKETDTVLSYLDTKNDAEEREKCNPEDVCNNENSQPLPPPLPDFSKQVRPPLPDFSKQVQPPLSDFSKQVQPPLPDFSKQVPPPPPLPDQEVREQNEKSSPLPPSLPPSNSNREPAPDSDMKTAIDVANATNAYAQQMYLHSLYHHQAQLMSMPMQYWMGPPPPSIGPFGTVVANQMPPVIRGMNLQPPPPPHAAIHNTSVTIPNNLNPPLPPPPQMPPL